MVAVLNVSRNNTDMSEQDEISGEQGKVQVERLKDDELALVLQGSRCAQAVAVLPPLPRTAAMCWQPGMPMWHRA